jgi:hypothetical protein
VFHPSSFNQFKGWLHGARSERPLRAAQFAFEQTPVIAVYRTRFGFRFRQAIRPRVFVSGFEMQRDFFDDVAFAFRRQSQDGEPCAHELLPVVVHAVLTPD